MTTSEDTGKGSFRSAIDSSNAKPGLDTIVFNIPGAGVHTIQPQSPFPGVIFPVIIDGTTQGGFTGTPVIQIDGSHAGIGANGLIINGGSSVVRGLAINRYADSLGFGGIGIVLTAVGGDTVEGNFIGTDVTGQTALGNYAGIVIAHSSSHNLIGGSSYSSRNLISGNTKSAITVGTGNTGFNVIRGNWIGVNSMGTDPLGNGGNGIFVDAPGDTIGGTTSGDRNIISFNTQPGIYLDVHSDGTVIQGNFIGVDVTGRTSAGNSDDGIYLNNCPGITIGGTTVAARNIISDNYDGIYLYGAGASGCAIRANFIGLDVLGMSMLGNKRAGIIIYGGTNDTVGGTAPESRNVIAGNPEEGIRIRLNASGNVIQGNYIGTDSSGTVSYPNLDGIYSKAAHDNTIGGSSPGAGNIIAGNDRNGVFLDTLTTNTTVEGNLIGVTRSGDLVPLANGGSGMILTQSSQNSIGGSLPGSGNVVGNNGQFGIAISDTASKWNTIAGNGIGTDGTGTLNFGNGMDGILVQGTKTTIGGSLDAQKNYIGNNKRAGIYLFDGTGNLISHNAIQSNGGLGIDIDPPGPNPNDIGDVDTGPNLLQNYPVIDTVLRHAASTVIKGVLVSAPNNAFTVEFFRCLPGDTSGYGEGQTLIGSTTVNTNGAGTAPFIVTLSTTLPAGYVVTSTATDTAGNTSEFSRYSKPIKILRPLSGELLITEEPDTIRWSVSGEVTRVGIGYSIDSGATYGTIALQVNANQNEYIWQPPKGTLTKKCLIAVWDWDHPLIGDTSDPFKIKGYELTRDSANNYVRYDVHRHGWQFDNSTSNMWPTFWWTAFDYASGTDPNTGLHYPARISKNAKSWYFPDWPLFVETYGQLQCYFLPGTPTYIPRAVEYWFALKEAYDGSCFGFAISSGAEFDNPGIFAQTLGSFKDLHDLSIVPLSSSASRTRAKLLNRLYFGQYGMDHELYALQRHRTTTPRETLEELKQMFKGEGISNQTLTLWNSNPSGGHAVNPYKIERSTINPRYLNVYVYDNNEPDNTTLYVEIDSALNTWSYSPLGYSGTKGLFLREPSANYLGSPIMGPKPTLLGQVPFAWRAGNSALELLTSSRGSIVITNAAGDSIGFADSTTFSSIADAVPIIPEAGRFHPPIGYLLPPGDTYRVVIRNTADSALHVSLFSDSAVYGYHRLNLHAGEVDDLKMGTSFGVINHDAVTKKADLVSIITEGNQERAFIMNGMSFGQGDSIRLNVVDRQQLNVASASDSIHYDLNIQYSSAQGNIEFTHDTLVLPPHAATRIVPSWDSLAYQPAKILFDRSGSGVFDDSVSIDNQTIGFYCDSVILNPNYVTGGKPASASVSLNTTAPHGGLVVHLFSSDTLFAAVPGTVFVPAGQHSAAFTVTTQLTLAPDTVVITAAVGAITRGNRLHLLPQGIETIAFNPAGGVIGSDSATSTVTISNPAPAGGKLITLTNGNPAIASIPASVSVPAGAISATFRVQTSYVLHLDSAVITGSSGARQASGKLLVSPFAFLTISPDTVAAGAYATIHDSIAVPAPAAGFYHHIRSSDSVTAPTSPVVYIQPGQTHATALVFTTGVSKDTVVTFTVTDAPMPISAGLLVTPADVKTFSAIPDLGCLVGEHGAVNQKKFIAGNPIRFMMTFSGPVPHSGAPIRVQSDRPDIVLVDSIPSLIFDGYNVGFDARSIEGIASPQQVIVTLAYRSMKLSDTIAIMPRVRYKFVALGDTGETYSSAVGINNAGEVLIYQGSGHFFIWQNGKRTNLDSASGFSLTSVSAINDQGHIAGQVGLRAALWKNSTTVILPVPPGTYQSRPTALTNDDVVIGTISQTDRVFDQRGCIWSAGAVTFLDDFDAFHYTVPNGINSSGKIVGTAVGRNYNYYDAALMWQNGHLIWTMGGSVIPYLWNEAGSINDSGTAVGNFFTAGWYGSTPNDRGWFMRRGNDTTRYPTLPMNYGSYPNHINSSGDVVGNMWTFDNDSYPSGFLFNKGLYYDLNCMTDSIPPRCILASMNWINDAGLIAGSFRIPLQNGHKEQACLLIPVGGTLGMKKSPAGPLPVEYTLWQNYPNPFNPVTTIRYELPKAGLVSLKVYNQLGQIVATLVNDVKPAGAFSVRFDGHDLASGVYYCRLIAGSYSSVKKMMLVK